MWTWIAGKFSGVYMWALEGLAILAVGLGLYEAGHFKGNKSGKDAVEVQTAHATIEAVTKAKDVQSEVAKLPPGAAEAELESEWTRGKEK